MIAIDEASLADRFIRYVQLDTQSDPNSEAYPTTEKQKELSLLLTMELRKMGLKKVAK